MDLVCKLRVGNKKFNENCKQRIQSENSLYNYVVFCMQANVTYLFLSDFFFVQSGSGRIKLLIWLNIWCCSDNNDEEHANELTDCRDK